MPAAPFFRPKPQSPCPVFPNHPEYAHPRKPESESNEPADSKEKGPTVFDRQAFPSVGVTGFEPATTRPPDVYSNRTELRPDSATEAVSSGLGLQI